RPDLAPTVPDGLRHYRRDLHRRRAGKNRNLLSLYDRIDPWALCRLGHRNPPRRGRLHTAAQQPPKRSGDHAVCHVHCFGSTPGQKIHCRPLDRRGGSWTQFRPHLASRIATTLRRLADHDRHHHCLSRRRLLLSTEGGSMMGRTLLAVFLMALVSYLPRVTPLAFLRQKIKSP